MENKSHYYNQLANEFMKKENYDKALENYLKAISINENEPMFYHNAGVCLLIKGEYERALSLFKHAIGKGLQIDETKYYILEILYEQKKYSEILNSEIPTDEKYQINSLMILLKSAMKTNELEIAKKIVNQLYMMGYSSQELDLIRKILY